MMNPNEAESQATDTAHAYAADAVASLVEILAIDPKGPEPLSVTLAPFASLLAAMVTAASVDYRLSVEIGKVEGLALPVASPAMTPAARPTARPVR